MEEKNNKNPPNTKKYKNGAFDTHIKRSTNSNLIYSDLSQSTVDHSSVSALS
jgi:hypothetical protein